MREYVSSTVFEIVDGSLIYRGWDVLAEHIYKKVEERKPFWFKRKTQPALKAVAFGNTGIVLRLVGDEPKLELPAGALAKLIRSDHAFTNGSRVDGNFVEVQIS